jgi:hypothetical protein
MVKLVALLTTFSAGIFLTHATEAYLTADKAYCISEQAPPPAGVDHLRAALIFAPVRAGNGFATPAQNVYPTGSLTSPFQPIQHV